MRYARATAGDHAGDPDNVVLVGFSSGASIGAVAALSGDDHTVGCVETGTSSTTRWVRWVRGPLRLGTCRLPDQVCDKLEQTDPDLWVSIDPYAHIGANPELVVRLMHGLEGSCMVGHRTGGLPGVPDGTRRVWLRRRGRSRGWCCPHARFPRSIAVRRDRVADPGRCRIDLTPARRHLDGTPRPGAVSHTQPEMPCPPSCTVPFLGSAVHGSVTERRQWVAHFAQPKLADLRCMPALPRESLSGRGWCSDLTSVAR